jgi:uncharacterized membrane protein YiaA
MQCPRCGLQNTPGATSCARCALPLTGSAPTGEPPGTYPPGTYPSGTYPSGTHAPAGSPYAPVPGGPWLAQPSQPAPMTYAPATPTAPSGPSMSEAPTIPTMSAIPTAAAPTLVRKLKPFVLTIGALAGATYAGWAGTARRSAFTDAAHKSLDELKSSDRLDSILLIVCTALVVLAIGWMFVGWNRAVPTLRVAALAWLGVGMVAAAVAGYLLGTWDQDPDTASRGYLTLAAAFALAAVALVLELVASRSTSGRDDVA